MDQENPNKRKNNETIMPPPSKKMHLPEPKVKEIPFIQEESDDELEEDEELDKEEILREIIEVFLKKMRFS